MKRKTVSYFKSRKGHEPLVCLTSYSAYMTAIMDRHVDMVLVGDSLGMVLYGMESTLPVTLEMMIAHGRAVARASREALVVVDMPFGSYQESPEQAFRNGARLMKEAGCAAVKLEGGAEMAQTVQFMVERGVPVLGHIGLKPQSVNVTGGYRMTGKTEAESRQIRQDAQALEQAGVFGVVLECVQEALAADITHSLKIPTIGIGASVQCDGQILVTEDILGFSGEYIPGFAKVYEDLARQAEKAISAYSQDVRQRHFPPLKKQPKPLPDRDKDDIKIFG